MRNSMEELQTIRYSKSRQGLESISMPRKYLYSTSLLIIKFNNVKFLKFLHSQNKKKLADKLGCSIRTIYTWSHRKIFPRKAMAAKLVDMAKGELSYNDIYTVSKKEKKLIETLKVYKDKKGSLKKEHMLKRLKEKEKRLKEEKEKAVKKIFG